MRQAVAEVAARHGDHQSQVGQHQTMSGLEIVVLAIAACERLLFLEAEDREAVHRLDIALQTGSRYRHRDRQGQSRRRLHANASFLQILALSPLEC